MTSGISRVKKWLMAYFLFVASFYIFQIGGEYNKILIGLFYLTTYFAEIISVYLVLKAYGKGHIQSKSFVIILVGLIFATTGQLIWFTLQNIFNISPFPAVSDLFYMIAYPLIFIGLAKSILAQAVSWKKSSGKFLNIVIVVCLILGILVFKFETSAISSMNMIWISKFILVFYSMADVALLSISAVILRLAYQYKGGLMFKPWLTVAIAQFVIFLGDILFAIYSKEYANHIWPYSMIGFMWFTANITVAYGFYSISDVIVQAQNLLKNQITVPAKNMSNKIRS